MIAGRMSPIVLLWIGLDNGFRKHRLTQNKIIETENVLGRGGDLAGMLDMADTMQEERPDLKIQPTTCSPEIKRDIADFWKIPADQIRSKPFVTICDTSKLRAVVFRDSFFETIIPFIAEDFNRIVYIWKQYDHAIMKELIEQQKPQIVIEEMVERLLILVREPSDGMVRSLPIRLPHRFNTEDYRHSFVYRLRMPASPWRACGSSPQWRTALSSSMRGNPPLSAGINPNDFCQTSSSSMQK